MNDLLEKGAFELAKLIRDKNISPVEVVRTHIERIQEVNGVINAVVADRFEQALQEAKEVEQAISRGNHLGLLAGVPITVKESIALKDFPFTSGSLFRKGDIATEDAESIKRLKREGAIILGKTNVPECNFWMESYNKVYGITRNPYDPGRTPGGSSGGEGAIIGAGGVPFGVGSDIAGSIRMPAAFCGIFGHRPTSSLISIKGHAFCKKRDLTNIDSSKIRKNLAIGPMCRQAKDLYPLLKIMSGAQVNNDDCQKYLNAQIDDWSNYTFYLCPAPDIQYTSHPDKEIINAVTEAGKIFNSYGARIKTLDSKLFYHAFAIWQSSLTDATDYSLNEEFGNGDKLSITKEILLRLAGKSRLTMPGLMMLLGERLMGRSRSDVLKCIHEGEKVAERLDLILNDKALIIMPVFPRVAPQNYHSLLRPLDWNYTTIFSAIDFPACSAPFGFNKDNIPLSIQIVGNRNQDYLILMAAKFIEKIKGGWKIPHISNNEKTAMGKPARL